MTRSVRVVIAVAVASLIVTACGGAATPATPTAAKPGAAATAPAAGKAGDAARGKELFASSCASCHGPDAKGLPNLGKDLTTSTFVKGQSDADLVAFINKGRPATDPANTTKVDMPPRGGNPALTDPQILDIVAYIRTLQQ